MTADGVLIASDSTMDAVSSYDAVVTLSDATPTDASDDVSFTLIKISMAHQRVCYLVVERIS